MRIVSSIFFFLIFQSFLFAQQKVKSDSYDLMLDNLLDHNVPEVSVSEALNLKGVVYLDTREKKEYQVSHIKNAKWVGFDNFEMGRVKGVSKSTTIVLYCSVGYRSEKITQKLKKAGYKNIYNLYGGIFEWVNQGQAVYSSNENKTEKVHAFDKVWGIWLTEGVKVY